MQQNLSDMEQDFHNTGQDPLDRWIEETARREAEAHVAAMFDAALDGFGRWTARRKRVDRMARVALAACLVAGVSFATWHAAPTPRFTAFNMASLDRVGEASALSIYMLDHE